MSEPKRGASGSPKETKRKPRAKKNEEAAIARQEEIPALDLADEESEGLEQEVQASGQPNEDQPEERNPSESVDFAATGETPSAVSTEKLAIKPTDEYCFQVFYDKQAHHFHVSVVEFPELRVTASTRDQAVQTMENRLAQHLQNIKRRGDQPPEAISVRRFPERLEIPVSQGLYRRLDLLSRTEKLALETLVVELLSASIEKRLDSRRPAQQQGRRDPQQQAPHGNQRHPQHDHNHNNQRNQGGHNRRGPRGGQSYDALQSRENFIDYVRNLEKGGGQWRKK